MGPTYEYQIELQYELRITESKMQVFKPPQVDFVMLLLLMVMKIIVLLMMIIQVMELGDN